MHRSELTVDWRAKVNPLFVLAIQFLRLIPSLVKKLASDHTNAGGQARAALVDACEESLSLLPPSPAKATKAEAELTNFLATQEENEWLADPEVRAAIAGVAAKVQGAPEALLRRGLDKPHWWMPEGSWPEFLQKGSIAESILNVLALLHFRIPLNELTQRFTDGDAKFSKKLSYSESRAPHDRQAGVERVLGAVKDRATKIVGRKLLLRGEPPGHQLQLRMVLFFGWDFGLRDLTINELHSFMNQIQVIGSSHDPETLRRYRDRLRRLIRNASEGLLLDSTSPKNQ